MAILTRISKSELSFSTGQRIVLDGEVFVEADGKASVVSAAAKSLDPKMGVVYLHRDGLGEVDGVCIQNDGKEPEKEWWVEKRGSE